MWTSRAGRTVVALGLALVLSACAGLLGDDAAGGAVAWDDAPASLGVIAPGVDVADEPADVVAATFRPGEDGEPLVVSDLVRTDSAGFAEVRWVEGALARLDVDTVLEVTALDLETGQPSISTRLEVGRVWNRLESGVTDYEVTTDVGTAAVRGTGFLVSCTPLCTFGVAEGVLELETVLGVGIELQPGEQITVDADGQPGTVEPFDSDDPWVQDNLQRDEDLGFPAVTGTFDPDGGDRPQLATARMEGAYTFETTVVERSDGAATGTENQIPITFSPECPAGPCSGSADRGEGRVDRFVWTGNGYALTYLRRPNDDIGACADGSASLLEDFVATFTPTEAEEVDGVLVVTAADVRLETVFTPVAAADLPSGCEPPITEAVTALSTGTGARSG